MRLFTFTQARVTRSGKAFNPFPVLPIATSSEFELGELLKLAVRFDSDHVDPAAIDALAAGDSSTSPPELVQRDDVARAEGRREAQRQAGLKRRADVGLEDGELDEAGEVAKRRRREQKSKRKDKRVKEEGQVPKRVDVKKHVGGAIGVAVEIELEGLPSTSCGYRAKNMPEGIKREIHDLKEYTDVKKFEVIKALKGQTSRPIVDSKSGKVFGVIIYEIDDKDYHDACDEAFEFLEKCRESEEFTPDESDGDRGPFVAVNYGTAYGQGSKEPHQLRCKHGDLITEILKHTAIIRLATFASYLFSMWAPGVYGYYRERMDKLYGHPRFTHLKRNFERSVWPCVAFNFGPRVCTYPHRDCMNCPFGWCAIQALGHYDYTLGGHLVLPDLKLLIEFPPGAIILIPSATLVHANTPVQPGERRISFTQFCPGGLFRFVDNGFRTEDQLKKEDKKEWERMMGEKATRWEMGLGLWSTMEEILSAA